MIFENVEYVSFTVRWVLRGGRRCTKRGFFSAGWPWVRSEVGRFLEAHYDLSMIVPGTVKIDLT